MSPLPHVLISSPIRNRAWILPEFLAAIEALDYDSDRLSYYFLANDCADDSAAILRAWCARRAAVIEEVDTGIVGWNRYARPHYDYGNLANLRNRILARFLREDASHLFSVDSDVIVRTDTLRALVEADQPVVAAVIANLPGVPVERCPARNYLFWDGHNYRHGADLPPGLCQVDVTGAVYLIRRDVVASGARYSGGAQGEDIGFCEAARQRGFHLFIHGGVRCEHRMDDPWQGQRRPR